MSERKPGFKITSGRGFHMTFQNGVTVSVQIGGGNYCANRDEPVLAFLGEPGYVLPASPDAEVAVFDAKGRWLTKEAARECFGSELGDDVAGYRSPEYVLRLMQWAQRRP